MTEANKPAQPLDFGSTDQLGHAAPEHDTYGPAGTYGCACTSRDAMFCFDDRYGHHTGERCECMCHQWREEDED